MFDAEKIGRYATKYWLRSGMTEWPTVRQAARSLHLRHDDFVADDGNGYSLTGVNGEGYVDGDLTIEASNNEVEAAWCGYWLPYSAGCYCGRHR